MQNPLNLIDPTGMAPEEGGATDPPKGATAGATYNDPDNGKLTYNGSTWQRADGAAVLNEVVMVGVKNTGKSFLDDGAKSRRQLPAEYMGNGNLAYQIKNSGRVEFGSLHPSPSSPIYKNDLANADDNIRDAANGELVYTSIYGHAKGKKTELTPALLIMLNDLSNNYTFTVSELAGAKHSFGSRHYIGKAVDITYINGERVSTKNKHVREFMELARKLGASEVIGPPSKDHNYHVHLGMPRN